MARRSTKRRARDIAEQGERVAVSSDAGTIALANVVEHGKRQAALVLLEVLELRTETRPATGRTAVHPQRTAHAVVGRRCVAQHPLELVDGGTRRGPAQLEQLGDKVVGLADDRLRDGAHVQ